MVNPITTSLFWAYLKTRGPFSKLIIGKSQIFFSSLVRVFAMLYANTWRLGHNVPPPGLNRVKETWVLHFFIANFFTFYSFCIFWQSGGGVVRETRGWHLLELFPNICKQAGSTCSLCCCFRSQPGLYYSSCAKNRKFANAPQISLLAIFCWVRPLWRLASSSPSIKSQPDKERVGVTSKHLEFSNRRESQRR